MPKAYSGDLRVRVIEMVRAGASRREAAEVFSLAGSTAVKWLQRWEKSGSAEAKPRGGSVSPLEVHAMVILEVVRAQPDATFGELLVVLKKQGIRTSCSALWRFFGRHDITFKKKSLCASERQRQDVARARRKWIREQGLLDPARLVFIDETSVNTQMVRLYGHGPRGVRLVDQVPFGNRKTFTFVAALRHNRMVAPLRECQIFCVRGFREGGSVVGSRISRTPPSNVWWPTKAGQRVLSRPLAAEGGGRRPAFTGLADRPYSYHRV